MTGKFREGNRFNYKTVAASQTTASICLAGGFLNTLTVVPASSGAGTVTLLDGSTTLIVTPAFAGGAETKPYSLHINAIADTEFKITTGASVSVIVSGYRPA
jgi:hypothetical protein